MDIDKTRIRQVLLNLLSNAAKFTEQGSITVRACVVGAMVQIDVQDTGIGIAPEHHALVFEEFRQVEDAFTRSYQGTGLGLPICQRMVELHGGTLWMTSTLGVGSTFSFTLPLAPTSIPASAAVAVRQELVGDAPPAASLPTIVVIDDDPDAQRIVREHLAHVPCEIVPVLASDQALAVIRLHCPQLILLDLEMPAPNGWEILRQVRSDPALAPIPVVIYSVADQSAQQVAIGQADYLVKPVNEALLVAAVQRWVTRPATVLVIDDDADSRRIIHMALGATYQVLEAPDGARGIELVRTMRPDLVVLDLMMPGMDGFQVLTHMRADPASAQTPVIVVTAKDLATHERQWLAERAYMLTTKGTFDAAVFARVVQKLAQR